MKGRIELNVCFNHTLLQSYSYSDYVALMYYLKGGEGLYTAELGWPPASIRHSTVTLLQWLCSPNVLPQRQWRVVHGRTGLTAYFNHTQYCHTPTVTMLRTHTPWCHWQTVRQHCWLRTDSSQSRLPHIWRWSEMPEGTTQHRISMGKHFFTCLIRSTSETKWKIRKCNWIYCHAYKLYFQHYPPKSH